MKATGIFLFLLMGFSTWLTAQDNRIEDIVRYLKNKQFNEARKLADELTRDETCNKEPRLWFYRALLYHNVYELHPETEKGALNAAYDSYLKTLEFDKDKKFNNETIKALGILANQFVYEGVELFNAEKYTEALQHFEKNIAIGSLPAINQIDTVILYNAALSAEKSGDLPKAALYFEELIKLHFGGVEVYSDLSKVYKKMGNTARFMSSIEVGIRSYPGENFPLYSELINYYLEKEDYKSAYDQTLEAIKVHPQQAGLHFIHASLCEAFSQKENAEAAYKKTIELDPGYTDAYFNLGSMYYNQGVDLLKKAKTKDEKNKADEFYHKALAMYEEVYKLTPDNQETIAILNNLYGYLNMPDKQKEMQGKLK